MRHNDWRNYIIKGIGVIVCAASVALAVFLFGITKGHEFNLTLFGYYLVPILTFIIGFIVFHEGMWRPVIFEYRGYSGVVDYSKEEKLYFGVLRETPEMITFESKDYKKVERLFQESVDKYIFINEHGGDLETSYHHSKAIG